MKTINVTFEDEEYAELLDLKRLKDNLSWREFILRSARS
jgi:predicted CopG family antitoxin